MQQPTAKQSYSDKLKDPRWQKRRLEILARDSFACQFCGSEIKTLHVHHHIYNGEPWEASDEDMVTLCEGCHSKESKERSGVEKRLLSALRTKNFSIDDLEFITAGFEQLDIGYNNTVDAMVIKHILTHYPLYTHLITQYAEVLIKEKQAAIQ